MKIKIREQEIKHKLRDIDDSIRLVEENFPSEIDNFLHLGLVKDGIYKKIEFAIENVIDICSILNSDFSLGVPSDDENIINNLEAKKIINKNLANKIKSMKSFRNVLVHRYGSNFIWNLKGFYLGYKYLNSKFQNFYKK